MAEKANVSYRKKVCYKKRTSRNSVFYIAPLTILNANIFNVK